MKKASLQRFLYKVWPGIYKAIDGFFYYLLVLIRKTWRSALNQIKNG